MTNRPVAKAKKKKQRQEEIEILMSPKAQKKLERELDHHLQELDEKADEREEYTKKILSVNDEKVDAIVEAMVAMLRRMAGTQFYFTYKGKRYSPKNDGEVQLLTSIQTRNFRWVVVRLLSATARWDIQVGNFKLPKSFCAVCGVPSKRKNNPVIAKKKKVVKKKHG